MILHACIICQRAAGQCAPSSKNRTDACRCASARCSTAGSEVPPPAGRLRATSLCCAAVMLLLLLLLLLLLAVAALKGGITEPMGEKPCKTRWASLAACSCPRCTNILYSSLAAAETASGWPVLRSVAWTHACHACKAWLHCCGTAAAALLQEAV